MSRSQHPHPRAYLRHQHWRAVAQQFRVTRRWHSPYGEKGVSERRAAAFRDALLTAETPCVCRYCCANPRHVFGVQSRREVLSVMALREQLFEAQLAHLDRQGLTPNWLKLRRELHHLWLGYRATPDALVDD
jgi:hypothetical protein